jgi:glycosyltransferase involved in cell wall biosynthesis
MDSGGGTPAVGNRMRTLVIAGEYPWPENSGSRIRLMNTLLGLSGLGPVELFSIVPSARQDFAPPSPPSIVAKVGRVGYHDTGSGSGAMAAMLRPWLPFSLSTRDGPKVRATLDEFVTGRYDLVWYVGVRSWLLAGERSPAPAVLDLDDLEDQKIVARLSVPGRSRSAGLGHLKRLAARAYSEEEARRWRRLQRRAGRRVRSVVVCSRLDAERATDGGVPRVAVVPNGYQGVEEPPGSGGIGKPPVLLFQGTLRYPPNAQAARYLVDEIGPAVRALVPDARIRLVGRATPALAPLDDPPRVTMVGLVPDIGAELRSADLVVVPIRFGSGTRVKIIEAFAHRIPVVSTSLGAEGLEARDGEHLLIGDDPESFASACARLLGDEALRARIVDAAHALFLDRYERGRAEEAVRDVARQVTES